MAGYFKQGNELSASRWLTEELLASKGGLCFMELVT
jgi:hypothetical protein